jgi:hypothetical protein
VAFQTCWLAANRGFSFHAIWLERSLLSLTQRNSVALAIIFTFGHPVGLGLLLSSSCVVYAVAALPKRSEIAVAPSSSRADTAAAVPSKTESAVAALLVSWWFVDAILPLPSTRESAAAAATTVSWFLICMLFANNPVASR